MTTTATVLCRYCGGPGVICRDCQVCQACANPKPATYTPPAPGEPGSWGHAVEQLGGVCTRCGLFICTCDVTNQTSQTSVTARL